MTIRTFIPTRSSVLSPTLFLLPFLTAGMASAQSTSGTIAGTVEDASGAQLPRATVSITQQGREFTQKATTNDQGNFRFLQLAPGTYSITINAPGFKVVEKKDIVLENAGNIDLREIQLPIGQTSEVVTISTQGIQLETENPQRSETLNLKQMQDTAVNGRSYLGLVGLIPGVSTVPNVQTASHSGLGSISVNGSRPTSNNLTIDGIGNVDTGNNGDQLVTISVDNTQEFRVITNNFNPEYGRSSGSQIIVSTRSGTDAYHGEGYIFHRNDSLNGNNWFNNRVGQSRSKQRYNDAGFNIGGPIQIPHLFEQLKTRAFFFVGQEYQNQLNPQGLRNVRVPTALERAGDFSQSVDSSGNPYPYIRDYRTGKACNATVTAGCFQDGGVIGRIPKSSIYAPGLTLLSLYPQPNINGGSFNFTSGISDSYPRREDVIRIDYNPTDRLRTFWRYLRNKDAVSSQYGSFVLGSNIPTEAVQDARPGSGMAVGATYTLNSRTVNEVNVGYGRNHIKINPTTNKLSRTTTGLNLPVLFPGIIQQDLIPDTTFGGRLANTGSLTGNNPPFNNGNTGVEFLDNFSRSQGQHAIKVGFYFQRSRKDQTNFGPVDGSYNFGDDSSNPYDSQQGFSNAALGVYNSFSQASNYINGQFRYTNVEWYGQDSWKIGRNFTFSYGIRFYYVQPQYDKNNAASEFQPSLYDPTKAPRLYQRVGGPNGTTMAVDPATGNTLPGYAIGTLVPGTGDPLNGIAIAGKNINRYLQDPRGINYAPRVGFSYALSPQTVIRGGGGMFYDRTQGNNVFGFVTNQPFISTPTLRYGLVSNLAPGSALQGPSNISSRQFAGKLPTVYDFDLEVQQELPSHILAAIAYVGTTSSQLLQQVNLNAIPYGTTFLAQNQDPAKVANNPTAPLGANAKDVNFLRKYQGYGDIAQFQNGSSSNYHSLQVAINRRYANGLFFSIAYTWSKALGVTSADGDYARIDGRTRQINYGPLTFDRRNTFASNIIYPFPALFAAHHFAHSVVDGWQVSSIIRFQTGAPFNPGFSVAGYGSQTLTGSYTEGARLRIIGNPFQGTSKDPYHRLNALAFQAPIVGDPGIGQIGANVFTAPGTENVDLTLQKEFRVHERFNFQLRADAFNVLNHTQFSGINGTLNYSAPGATVNTNPASSTPAQYNGFGSVSSAAAPRIVQLIGRITF